MFELSPGLHGRFLRGLNRNPEGPALRVGAKEMTYGELHELALRWAGALRAAAVPLKAVGVLAGKGMEAYLGVLAGLYAGATVVPMHAEFPAVRLRSMIRDANVGAVVVDSQGMAALREALGPDSGIAVLASDDVTSQVEGVRTIPVAPGDALSEPHVPDPGDTAYVLFTSGSTGRPKGVPISHASTDHYFSILDERYDFNEDDVFSQTFDLNFDCAMFDLFCAWGAGALVHTLPAQAYRDLPGYITERGMTVWFSTPSAITLARRTAGLAPDSMPTLRWSLFAGEALKQRDAVEWSAAASGSTLENLYGPTELTVTVTGHRWDPASSPALCVNGLVPIGGVHGGHDHLLIGAEGQEVPDEGELCVTGPQSTGGYLNPGDDHGRFLERDGRTWYRTGDRVRRLGNGELIYLGRLDSQVQIQGWRVELAEVEHALRGAAGVEDAVAVTREEDGGTELVVFYTGARTSPVDLARHARTVLPKGMVPREYRYVEAFPLNPNRKIDRGRLRETAAGEPRPVGSGA